MNIISLVFIIILTLNGEAYELIDYYNLIMYSLLAISLISLILLGYNSYKYKGVITINKHIII